MKKLFVSATLVASLSFSANSLALGYLSRDCPQAGAKELNDPRLCRGSFNYQYLGYIYPLSK